MRSSYQLFFFISNQSLKVQGDAILFEKILEKNSPYLFSLTLFWQFPLSIFIFYENIKILYGLSKQIMEKLRHYKQEQKVLKTSAPRVSFMFSKQKYKNIHLKSHK